jgi:hypothetical protein
MTSLENIIETGSYSNREHLNDLIKRLNAKITLLKKRKSFDEMFKAEIFRDEFVKLRDEL